MLVQIAVEQRDPGAIERQLGSQEDCQRRFFPQPCLALAIDIVAILPPEFNLWKACCLQETRAKGNEADVWLAQTRFSEKMISVPREGGDT